MTERIFTVIAYAFFATGTVMSVIFVAMMIADDFHTPNKRTPHK